MELYETNSGLGHRQLVYLLKIEDNAFLCVGLTMHIDSYRYNVGFMIYDMEEYELEKTSWKLDNSDLYGTFMFEYVNKAIEEGRLILGDNKPKDLNELCFLVTPFNIKCDQPSKVIMEETNGKEWFEKCKSHFLDYVGSMSESDIKLFENSMTEWLFCDNMESIIRSGYLNRISAYQLSKVLTNVLEKQNK